jgi:thymidine kinase
MAGQLTMYVGGMFSGKTSALLNTYDMHKRAGKKVILLKPAIDTRYDDIIDIDGVKFSAIKTHNGASEQAMVIEHVSDIIKLLNRTEDKFNSIFIDEIQFFDEHIIGIIKTALITNVNVYVAGLDVNYKNEPFKITANLMAIADKVEKISGVCRKCGAIGRTISFKKEGSDNVIDVGGEDKYIPLCLECYTIEMTKKQLSEEKEVEINE